MMPYFWSKLKFMTIWNNIEHSTLVGQHPMKSLLSVYPPITKFSQDRLLVFSDVVLDES